MTTIMAKNVLFGGRQLAMDLPKTLPANGPHCGPLSKELVQSVAKDSTVLVTVMDQLVWNHFGESWVENVQLANISYWLVAALDPQTSLALAAAGVKQCFNAPSDRLKYQGAAQDGYKWGSHHWHMTTWNKVHVMKAVYELGVDIIHSDADVVWFSDPLPFFARYRDKPVHVLIATDMTTTYNAKGDVDVERESHPFTNINTGIYWIKQWPQGNDFMAHWQTWQAKDIGHDQDGFNLVARGQAFRGDNGMPHAVYEPDKQPRMFWAAHFNSTGVAFLPGSMFGNAYTYVNTRLHEKLEHPLYEVHWVWGGSTLEAKRQNMRDAIRFHDPPEYYTTPQLLSFDLDFLEMPAGFNDWPDSRTEEMIQFHMKAANHQLQQAYYAFAMALVLNRTVVMPKFRCYCSKNWYMTQACRINGEKHTTFPFICALSQVMRVKRLERGLRLPDPASAGPYAKHSVHIREYSFLENPKVPAAITGSVVTIVPSSQARPASLTPDKLLLSEEAGLAPGHRKLTVVAPMDDRELVAVLEKYQDTRITHFTAPARTFSRFANEATHVAFDIEIQKRATTWCCRSPADMKLLNATDKLQLVMLPKDRHANLPIQPEHISYAPFT